MIGPVYPYKGGIAHYTGMMYKALSKRHKVRMISYKLQYPKILFKKEQKDFSNKALQIEETKYLINTADPINCVKVAHQIKKMNADLVVFQWWHPYFAPCYWIMNKVLGKSVKKIFVCHNVFPHERFPLDKILTKMVLKNGDYFITHSGLDTRDLLEVKKQAKYHQAVIPVFNVFKIKNMTREQARECLNIQENEKIILFFGFVRAYKGLIHIINVMPEIKNALENVKLYIVGDFAGDKEQYIEKINILNINDCVKIFDGYIPDEEVEKFFAAADVVVLPYESATQSGIVQIAYSFRIPVIVTNVGGLPEVVEDGKTGYIVEVNNDSELAKKTIQFFKEDNYEKFKDGIEKQDYRYSWDRLSEVVEDLYFE